MAYRIDPTDENALVLDGHRNGIADSPYEGISDMRNVNIIPIPGEASVNFATSTISQQPQSGNVTSASAGSDTIALSGATFESGTAVVFAGGSLPGNVVEGTIYWAVGSAGTYELYTNYARTVLLNISSDGTGTWATVDMGRPKYFTVVNVGTSSFYWMIDANGRAWSNTTPTTGGNSSWTYTGNKINNNSIGNGIGSYVASDGTAYVFVFSNSSIDYTVATTATSISWVYQWNPSAGTNGGFNANPTQRLKTSSALNYNHETIVATDNRFYYTDANWVGRFYQTAAGTAFDPTNTSTYTFDQTSVLPFNDVGNCITQLGNDIIVGGQKNVIYRWDRFSANNHDPILIAEFNTRKLVTVNTNTYIFSGNRGRIYITNGSQAQFYKKIPDHLSGTVEPYYTWGGACSNKNQLYFSASVTTNANVAITTMGGVWSIDLDNEAIRLTNKLSYATYAGYASAIIPNFLSTAAGTGLFIGWDSGSSTYGLDTTVSDPYTGSQAYIDYDLIPIGTFLRPKAFKTVEYKLSEPLASGESVSIYYRLVFDSPSAGYTLVFTSSTAGVYSDNSPVNFENAQWIQLRAVLNSVASNPSYVRLREIRIK